MKIKVEWVSLILTLMGLIFGGGIFYSKTQSYRYTIRDLKKQCQILDVRVDAQDSQIAVLKTRIDNIESKGR